MSTEEKRKKRLENKKRKIEAYLAVAELNDGEKKRKIEVDEVDLKPLKEKEENKIPKPQVSGDEYLELKQRLKERKKLLTSLPLFRLKSVGEESLLDLEKKDRIPLFMSDIQALLTYCICGDKAPYWPHRWCTLQKWNRLSNIVCVILDGLGVEDLEARREEFSWILSNLKMMEVVSPAHYDSSVAQDLALIPISRRQQSQLIKEFGSLEAAAEKNEAGTTVKAIFPVVRRQSPGQQASLKLKLLLSAKQLVLENYPLPLEGLLQRFKDYVLTKEKYQEVHEGSPIYSLDCEMCLTEGGMELARICVVNESLKVVYHSLVLPQFKVVNYLTQYSGITSKLLQDVTTRLSDVQKSLQDLLPEDSILVGQSLNSDLNALKMMHPYVIDTSVIFNITGDRRRKSKLSTLANIFLNTEIQGAGGKGHNPEEDAKAAMSLVLLKLQEGYHYGDVLLGGRVPGIHEPMEAPDAEQRIQGRDVLVKESVSTSLSKTAVGLEKTVAVTVSSSCRQTYLQLESFKSELKLFQTGDDFEELLEKGKAGAVNHTLSISHLDLSTVKQKKVARRAERFCREMYEHTSSNGLFLLILPGSKESNASAGITIVKPLFDKN